MEKRSAHQDISNNGYVIVKGARVHNLKNINVEIPRDSLVVITGLSGSGKSSLAFDTLYAEGQRRYVESLSSYARQFLGRMNKPDVDYIHGISPAIAIEQKVSTRNPRSTVGTSTEIYEYLKLLFARIGVTISPVSGKEVVKHTVSDVVNEISKLSEGTNVILYAEIRAVKGRTTKDQLEILLQQGFSRVMVNEKAERIDDILLSSSKIRSLETIHIIIDRFIVAHDNNEFLSRLADSISTAFYEGHGTCFAMIIADDTTKILTFSDKFEVDGITFEEPTTNLFSFNNPYGACKTCEGFGSVIGIDEDLVIPDKNLSVFNEAVACWKGEKMSLWKEDFILKAYKHDFNIHRPYAELSKKEKDLLWSGTKGLHGINEFFKMVEENIYKIQYRVLQSRYRGKTLCPECHGTRLRYDANYVKVGGLSISELTMMQLNELQQFFKVLKLNAYQQKLSKRLLTEITTRLQFLLDVGLGYLTLNRLSMSLSGGESQRINLATFLGSNLIGSMYILDEPSIGLHPRDTDRLISVLKTLRDNGNTVIVVEHDENIIRASDYIIDIGPEAGTGGGEVIYQGSIIGLTGSKKSITAKYLNHEMQIKVPPTKRNWKEYIEVKGCCENNLKNID